MESNLQYPAAAHAKLPHRSSNVPSTEHHHSDHAEINVGKTEREFSIIGGTVLAVCGLLRGSLSGLALAAIGGAMIWRGHSGHCQMYEAMGVDTSEEKCCS
jgi:uncharacterized membrane protein